MFEAPAFATSGNSTTDTALNTSTFGIGQQQRAQNLFAEQTFVCPSYWLAESFSTTPHKAYKYQYSVIPAEHAGDLTAFLGPPTPSQEGDLARALMTLWGNFITRNDPSIPADVARGEDGDGGEGGFDGVFPQFEIARPVQVNLNTTGGMPYEALLNVTAFGGEGVRNAFGLVDAYAWEGGRGTRCDFWRSVATLIPG